MQVASAENERSCLSIVRVCTHWEISQTRKSLGLKSEPFGGTTAKTREQQAINMVDRAGFEPATFRTLDLDLPSGRSSAPKAYQTDLPAHEHHQSSDRQRSITMRHAIHLCSQRPLSVHIGLVKWILETQQIPKRASVWESLN